MDLSGLDETGLDNALAAMILSASGWRGIFAIDGDAESRREEIDPAHGVITAAAGGVFAEYLRKNSGSAARDNAARNNAAPVVIVGMDTRPTGSAIADTLIRSLLFEGCDVRFAFITAAPEIMAYARTYAEPYSERGAGFVYISASHNPIGHNGLKFGLTDGGVLPGVEAARLIDAFKTGMAAPDRIARASKAIQEADREQVNRVYREAQGIKDEAYRAYLRFTRELVGAGEATARFLKDAPLGIVADLNGSARTLSIDRELLSGMGVSFKTINDEPRKIVHRIVPEGESLEPCRRFLEEAHRQDPSYALGYVPDCDGDRGNLVIWDGNVGQARILAAQEVFALACAAELAYLVWAGELRYDNRGNALDKVAVAVNDPTSLMIDRIAHAFDVPVFRAEVGEANVVGLARKLRARGYTVRILGEGSAGGAITHPSAVRDPVDTVAALIKLLTLRSAGDKKGLFELWRDLSDQAEVYRPDFTLEDIIAALPAFVTTGMYTPDAVLHVSTKDHALLKDRYQGIFLREWEERKEQLAAKYGITGWEAAGYIKTEEKRGLTRFGEAGSGGLRILFSNKAGHEIACIWMRGSGTEPVFRVMADVEGSNHRMERDLIEWQRRMVAEADSAR
jgi:phosphoglucomutase